MSSVAKGSFPGRPKKKINKKAVKYQANLQQFQGKNLESQYGNLKNYSEDLKALFKDDKDKECEFVGFSSEECGLRAYKRVSKEQSLPLKLPVVGDILGSNQIHTDKDKVVTRRSFALDSLVSKSRDSISQNSVSAQLPPADNVDEGVLSSQENPPQAFDGAFLKYKNSKLDFHRLSRKARNKECYEDYSAEEQAKLKDTSTASLKYASEIYLAKGSASALGLAKSPIKPATFIPPPNHSANVKIGSSEEITSSESFHFDQDKGFNSSEDAANDEVDSFSTSTNSKLSKHNLKPAKGFVLPSKSVRSSRIIKANRRYIDTSSPQKGFDRKSSSLKEEMNTGRYPELDFDESSKSFQLPNKANIPVVSDQISKTAEKSMRLRKPVLKENAFHPPNESENHKQSSGKFITKPLKNKNKNISSCIASERRHLIRGARFKHPTSSDALVRGIGYSKTSPSTQNRNPIRKARFTAPASKPVTSPKLGQHDEKQFGDLGLTSEEWNRLSDSSNKKWTVGDTSFVVPSWSRQEIHNLLHGCHTFGRAWSRIARHYEFDPYHKDWLSVCNKGKKCFMLGLVNDSYKVRSSILLQLKPKLAENPNVTVYTPSELTARGLTSNIPCHFGVGKKRALVPAHLNGKIGKQWKKNLISFTSKSENKRIFGTHISGNYEMKEVHIREISKDDLYLGLSSASMLKMLRPRKKDPKKKKTAWAPWEIHNILHGIHYFGVGAWATICVMYRFLVGRDNLAVRARFKSVCCRGLIVASDVRPDILPRLHVVLSKKGKMYFQRNKISVTLCSLSKKYSKREKSPLEKKIPPVKEDSSQKIGLDLNGYTPGDADSLSVSPSRRAIHLFGTAPLWDDTTQLELLEDADESTPVIDVLEKSLRKNFSALNSSKRRSSADDVNQSPSSPEASKSVQATGVTKASGSRRNRSKSETKSSSSPVKSKARGPRIKHVCRRASLVTGLPLATTEDEHPHLTALPQQEREKIMAHPENFKDVDSCSEGEKNHSKTIAVSRKKGRKRAVSKRCGQCSSCMEAPCLSCDACRKFMDSANDPSVKVKPCKLRKPCLNISSGETAQPVKRTRKSHVYQSTGSRKSSRLQEQIASLLAPTVVEQQSLNLSTVEGPPYNDTATIYDSNLPSSPDSSLSPSSDGNIFDRLNAQWQTLVKIDSWKGIYDLDLLWKSGGHALISSHPPPPNILCLLCGSCGHPNEPVDRLIHCASCCEPFHPYCAEPNCDHPVVAKAMEDKTWVCKRCKYCLVCGMIGPTLECKRCMRTYHPECLGPTYPVKFPTKGIWMCMQCACCNSCGASKPGSVTSSTWTHDYTMCQKCGELYDRGNFCPICQKCYSDEDYDCRMIQCAKCKRWIHSKCENLSVEMYTILSHMPDSVQYKCPKCDGRSNKLKEIYLKLDKSATILPNIEKIRTFLSRLPPPLWKKLIEKEIQTGLETVIMSLFLNNTSCNILTQNESTADPVDDASNPKVQTKKPRNLYAIRFSVHNQHYNSISHFFDDVTHVINLIPDEKDREATKKIFGDEAGKVFKWFNFETGTIKDEQVDKDDVLVPVMIAPSPKDHNYSICIDQDLIDSTPNTQSKNVSTTPSRDDENLANYDDKRQCVFCNKYKDDRAKDCGRLLYCGQDEWCHVNCALWSAEVYEQHDGSLENVHSAASRSKMMRCDYCRVPGATVGCNTRGCPKNYHFACARLANCSFQNDKKVFCRRHSHLAKGDLVTGEGFNVERLVCVDNDEMRPNRHWHRGIPASSVTVNIGSLRVQQLGKLSLSSDSKDYLKPISYRITRVFWSAYHADQKTLYTITVSESAQSSDQKLIAPKKLDDNRTISHSPPVSARTSLDARSKSPLLHSPPKLRRTDLADRLKVEPHIGPLSPTRRIGNGPIFSYRRGGGSYSIISSINTTLPQAVTPYPTHLADTAPLSTASFESDTTTSFTRISYENPFLNRTPLPRASSPEKQTSPIKKDIIDSILADSKLKNSSSTPRKIKCLKVKRKTPCSSDKNSTSQAKMSDEDVANNFSSDKDSVPPSQTGYSGSLLRNSTSGGFMTGTISPKTALKACRVVLTSPVIPDNYNSALLTTKKQNDSISLIRSARNALDVEKQSQAKISLPVNFNKASSKSKSKNNIFKKQGKILTYIASDSSFQLPKSETVWKKISTTVLASKARPKRGADIDYNEEKSNDAFEEAIGLLDTGNNSCKNVANNSLTCSSTFRNTSDDFCKSVNKDYPTISDCNQNKRSVPCKALSIHVCDIAKVIDSNNSNEKSLTNLTGVPAEANDHKLSGIDATTLRTFDSQVDRNTDEDCFLNQDKDSLIAGVSCDSGRCNKTSDVVSSSSLLDTSAQDERGYRSLVDALTRDEHHKHALVDSDDEQVKNYPSTQLRKFALKSSKQSDIPNRLTRARVKSHEANSTEVTNCVHTRSSSQFAKILPKFDCKTSSQNTKKICENSRRYPRRNTYNCLKSFSGLSPNYVLASYSRQKEASTTNGRKQRKKLSTQRSTSTKPVSHSQSNKSSLLICKNRQTTADALPLSIDPSNSADNECESELNLDPSEPKNNTLSITTDNCTNKERINRPTQSPHRVDQLDSDSNIKSADVSQSSLPQNSLSDRNLFDDISAFNHSEEVVTKSNVVITTSPLHNNQSVCSGTTSPKNDCSFSSNESVEQLRGRGVNEEENIIPQLTFSESLLEQSDSDLTVRNSQPDDLNTEDLKLLSEKNPAPDEVTDSALNIISESSLFQTSECPVLDADEVKTVLECSRVTDPKQVAPVVPTSASVMEQSLSLLPAHPSKHLSTIDIVQANGIMNPSLGPVLLSQSSNINNQSLDSGPIFPSLIGPMTNQVDLPRRRSMDSSKKVRGRKLYGQKFSGLSTNLSLQRPLVNSSLRQPLCVPPQGIRPTAFPAITYPVSPLQNLSTLPYSMRVTMSMTPLIGSERLFYSPPIHHRKPHKKRISNPLPLMNYSGSLTPVNSTLLARPPLPVSVAHSLSMTAGSVLRAPLQTASSFQNVAAISSPNYSQCKPNLNQPMNECMVSSEKPPAALHDQVADANTISPIEQLIDFYSAKNKLSPEEKAIVRSIITKQIQTNNLSSSNKITPKDQIESETSEKNIDKSTVEITNKRSSNPKKRRLSRDQSKSASKSRRKRKEKLVPMRDFDKATELVMDKENFHSCLYDVYAKRRSFSTENNPSTQILSACNIFLGKLPSSNKENRPPSESSKLDGNRCERLLTYEIQSEDGYCAKGTDLQELIDVLLLTVYECRITGRVSHPSTILREVMSPNAFLGLSHDAVRFLVEQLPGARHCPQYKAKYHKHKKIKEEISHINPHGCCRAEQYKGRSKPDMFSFLASKHRPLPEYQPDKSQSDEMLQLCNRRATSMESLPMAMRFRHLRTFSKQAVGVYRSSIHGRGLYCKRDIDAGEMILEYTGQTIRRELTDKREQYYESKSIGCYMFRMDDRYVVDATVMGSAARFINHSCEPNCYSKIVHIEGKKHIVIFALRKIHRGEELTYDYKFPIEDDEHKIHCNCGSRSCRKYMN